MEGENFKGDFTPEGVLKLQERLREKLRDLIGDFPDETLVEYVIVLLNNGRSKDEATKELNVFLGNHSTPFISWLWEHLSSKLHLYSQNEPNNTDKNRSIKASKSKNKRDVKNEIKSKEIFPLRSVVTHILHGGDDRNKDINKKQPIKSPNNNNKKPPITSPNNNNKKPPIKSPNNNSNKRRVREDESQTRKRGPIINVSNRLLQSAMRDAVNPIWKTNSIKTEYSSPKTEYSSPKTEYSPSKRLCSVVLASPKEELTRTKSSSSRSVFDRLTKVTSSVVTKVTSSLMSGDFDDRYEESKQEDFDDDKVDENTQMIDENKVDENTDMSDENNDDNKVDENNEMSESDKEMETIPNISIYNDILEDNIKIKMSPNEDLSKVESRSVNENDDVSKEISSEKSNVEETLVGDTKIADTENVPQKPTSIQVPLATSYTTSNPLHDVDSRSVIITNVNFAATKDALSRHFNKFGAVLKVMIINDPNTGLPTGCACVEFLQKESAELALSVNGTSFMSRIVKVIRRDSAEASQYSGWCGRGGSSSLGSYPRGVASFRGRPPIKTRRLQWTRGASSAVHPPPAAT